MHVRTHSVYALMSTYMHAVRSWCTATCTCAYVHVCREHLHLGKGLIPQLRGQHDGRDDDDQDNETAQRPGNASRNTACARAHTPRTCIASGLSVRTPPLIKTNYVHQQCRANRSNTHPHIIYMICMMCTPHTLSHTSVHPHKLTRMHDLRRAQPLPQTRAEKSPILSISLAPASPRPPAAKLHPQQLIPRRVLR